MTIKGKEFKTYYGDWPLGEVTLGASRTELAKELGVADATTIPCVLVVSTDLSVIAHRIASGVSIHRHGDTDHIDTQRQNMAVVVDSSLGPCEWGLIPLSSSIQDAKTDGVWSSGQ